jgi:hypothetical protein
MNKDFLITIALALCISSCSSQSISRDKVPSIVLNTFKAQYPNSDNVEWEKHGSAYEAEFDVNDSTEIAARIDEAGKLMLQKEDLTINELDPRVMTAIQGRYKEYAVDDVERIQKGSTVYYQVELKAKGRKEVNLVFSADGREDTSISYWD